MWETKKERVWDGVVEKLIGEREIANTVWWSEREREREREG